MTRVEVKTRRWRRVEYERLIETGFFQPGDLLARAGEERVSVSSLFGVPHPNPSRMPPSILNIGMPGRRICVLLAVVLSVVLSLIAWVISILNKK